MYYNTDLINELNNLYAIKRSNAQTVANGNIFKAQNSTEYVEICNNLRGFSYEIAKAKYDGDENLANELKNKRKALIIKKRNALKKIGLTEQDLLPAYECKICGDTGITESGVKCKCFYNNMNKLILSQLELENPLLPTFNDDTLSKNSYLEKYYDGYKRYVENFDTTDKYFNVFTGTTGTGKTFLAGAITSELQKQGKSVLFLNSFDLNKIFLKYHTAKTEEKQTYFDILLNVDLLVIDELGVEPILKNVTAEYLYLVANGRLQARKHLLITTNLSLAEIGLKYGERLTSRLTSKAVNVIKFTGKDLRKI